MKKIQLLLTFAFFAFLSNAQFSCDFQFIPQAGAVYCSVFNQTTYLIPVRLVATDVNGHTKAWNGQIYPNNSVTIGPSNGWNWEPNETITVLYHVYGKMQSVSWRYTPQQNNVSFHGKHCNGIVGCSCPGFEPITDREVWKEAYCKHCGHQRRSHK